MTEPLVKLRPFQHRVFDAVMRGESVILQAPTGAGKTRAALAPFLQNLAYDGDKLPLTCRYAVPLRVLATQFFKDYKLCGEQIDQYMDARLCATYKKFDQKPVQIQTGEQPNDPSFESALTFCTIDQLLASALAIPYGIGNRRANLNVGTIFSSYLVFDEFHLFPLERDHEAVWGARTTTLELLKLAKLTPKRRLAPFVLMTATFSTTLLGQLATLLGATVEQITDKDEERELNADRVRVFHVHDAPMRAQMIVDMHHGTSLVVCNTVLRSQQLYVELRRQVREMQRPTRVLLLHSRFTDDDRSWLQDQLAQQIGKEAWDQELLHDIIIVATQVVEVGLDISVEQLHTEIAPANSVIQRAGRCARFAKQEGHVHLYPLDSSDQVRYAPYTKRDCEATLEAFAAYHDQHVGFREEQAVIDRVHTEDDERLLSDYGSASHFIRGDMFRSLSTNERGVAPRLIRNVNQLSVLIHDDPNAALTVRPWQWQSFGIYPYSLARSWPALAEQWSSQNQDEAFCHRPEPMVQPKETEVLVEGERTEIQYRWEPVGISEGIVGQRTKADNEVDKRLRDLLMVVLPPSLATYDAPPRNSDDEGTGLGFVLRDGRLDFTWSNNIYRSSLRPEYVRGTARRNRANYGGYTQESYIEHIQGLYNAYHHSRLRNEVAYAAMVIEEALNLPKGAIDQAIRLAIACHDIGKLSKDWQRWCELWQNLLVETYPELVAQYHIQPEKRPWAHTDNNGSRDHFNLQREVYNRHKLSRPHHACESAELAYAFIEQTLQAEYSPENGTRKLARATVAAIARHHAPQSQEYTGMALCNGAMEAIKQGIEVVRAGQAWHYDLTTFPASITTTSRRSLGDDQLTLPSDTRVAETFLYYLLVRVLRLADARSFSYKNIE